jgi:hypothetical protein
MCNSFSQISHSVRFLQFSISIHRKMKLRSSRKKRSNIDSSVIAKESLKTRIKFTVKSFEDISSSIIFAIFFSSQNSSQKSVKKSIKKSIKKSVKSVFSSQVKQLIKQSVKSVKKSIRKALISFSNVNYFVLLKISNDDEIDDDLLTDDEVKKSVEWLVRKKTRMQKLHANARKKAHTRYTSRNDSIRFGFCHLKIESMSIRFFDDFDSIRFDSIRIFIDSKSSKRVRKALDLIFETWS